MIPKEWNVMSNLYLNKKLEKFVKVLVEHPSLEAMNTFEDAEEMLQLLQSKLNKKKIDKKAKLPSLPLTDLNQRKILFYPREGNGAIMIKAEKEVNNSK